MHLRWADGQAQHLELQSQPVVDLEIADSTRCSSGQEAALASDVLEDGQVRVVGRRVVDLEWEANGRTGRAIFGQQQEKTNVIRLPKHTLSSS